MTTGPRNERDDRSARADCRIGSEKKSSCVDRRRSGVGVVCHEDERVGSVLREATVRAAGAVEQPRIAGDDKVAAVYDRTAGHDIEEGV